MLKGWDHYICLNAKGLRSLQLCHVIISWHKLFNAFILVLLIRIYFCIINFVLFLILSFCFLLFLSQREELCHNVRICSFYVSLLKIVMIATSFTHHPLTTSITKIFLRLFRNSEANTSDFLENLEYIFPKYFWLNLKKWTCYLYYYACIIGKLVLLSLQNFHIMTNIPCVVIVVRHINKWQYMHYHIC